MKYKSFILSLICYALSYPVTGYSGCSFDIENKTGLSPYKITAILKSQDNPTNSCVYQNIRLRLTFHESPRAIKWLNENQLQIPKAFVPELAGETSSSCPIQYPGLTSSFSQYLTFYVTADVQEGEDLKKVFLCGKTLSLIEPKHIQKVHVIFKGLSASNKLNLQVRINDNPLLERLISSHHKNYFLIDSFKNLSASKHSLESSEKKIVKRKRLEKIASSDCIKTDSKESI